jgi:hypothetical protein
VKLEGSLEMFPLRELIEMTVYSSVTGSLNIYSAQGDGHIFFRDGQPYHAIYNTQVTGMAAVVAIFEMLQATFTFVADATADEETLASDPLDLVENAERIARRWQRLRPDIPDLSIVPHLLCSQERARFNISPAHWSIFTAIDGQKSLETIIQALNMEPVEVCEAIVQMKSDHLIELKQSNMFVNECMIEPTPTRPTGHPRTAGAGVFDRLLGNSAPVKPQHAEPVPTRKEDTTPGNTPPSVKTRSANEEDHILRLLRN